MKKIDPFSFLVGFLMCAFEALAILGISRLFGVPFDRALLIAIIPTGLLAYAIGRSHGWF